MNNDTQLNIEKFLLEYTIKDTNSIEIENIYGIIGKLSKNIQVELLKSSDELIQLIENFKNRTIYVHYELRNLKENERSKYFLSKILSSISVDFVVSILLAKLFFLMNNSNQENTNVTKILTDLGKQLIQKYFYELYLINKSDLNLNNSKKEEKVKYSLSI